MTRWSKAIFARIGLRLRLSIFNALLISVVVGLLALFFMTWMVLTQREALDSKISIMRGDLARKGMALARNVALSSERALAFSDYLFLAEVLETTVKNDNETVYGALTKTNGETILKSGEFPADSDDSRVMARWGDNKAPMEPRELMLNGRPILEVAASVAVAGEFWGVVRFGLSLESLEQEIAAAEERLAIQVKAGVASSVLGAIILALMATGIAVAWANSLTAPLRVLMAGAHRLHAGEFGEEVVVNDIPEFMQLADAFNDMSAAIEKRETELAAALAEAEEANRLKSEFLANVSHELKTPLNAVVNVPFSLLKDYQCIMLWTCSSCEKQYEPDTETVGAAEENQEVCPSCSHDMTLAQHVFFNGSPKEHFYFNKRALQAGRHLLSVVNDILDFSKLEAGKIKLSLEQTVVCEVLDELRNTIGGLAAEKGLAFDVSCSDRHLNVVADRVKIIQILVNLTGNAIKFTDAGGRVSVSAKAINRQGRLGVVFSVADTGIGIPKTHLDAVFERFRQVDGGHTRKYGGTGLGLAITKELVGLHEGEMSLDSTEGVGSTFSVTLWADGPTQMLKEASPAVAKVDATIMIVDDDQDQLNLLERFLTYAGYRVAGVTNPEDVWERLKEVVPDLIILDIMMPHVSGLTVLRFLKESSKTKDIPVIVSSAYHNNRPLAERLGAVWLEKPWNEENMIEKVASLVKRSKTAQVGHARTRDTSSGRSRHA